MDDFRSHEALEKPLPRSANTRLRREWAGLSVFDSLSGAVANAAATHWRIGIYIAEVEIPDETPIFYEGPGRRGHWNLYWADPAHLLACVVRVVHGPSVEE